MKTLAPAPSITDQVYTSILDAICDGELEPGARLTQDSVASMLSVSRQPVGQALMLLKQQRLLVDAGRRGLRVAPLEPAFLRSIYQLRQALEPYAATLAAANATAADLARGDALLAAGRKALASGSIGGLIDADMAFHMHVYDVAGNPLFVDVMGQLWNHLRRAMREVIQHPELREAVWKEHAAIHAAIRDGDGPRAAALINSHLERAAAKVDSALLSPPAAARRPASTRSGSARRGARSAR